MFCSNMANLYGMIKTKIHNKTSQLSQPGRDKITIILHLDYGKPITNLLVTFIERFIHSFFFASGFMNPCPYF